MRLFFIDGTVEGTNINYPDKYASHDHTYFGNGCSNGWGIDGNTGSEVACGTRLSPTKDGENQINGTYYNHSSATLTEVLSNIPDNHITPDSFCPLGWQLPYGGTGGDYYNKSKSMVYLQSNEVYGTPFILGRYPLSEIYGGYINFETGALFVQTITGDYYTNTSRSDSTAYRVRMGSTGVIATSDSLVGKNIGSNIRCTLGISNLKAFHGIRVRL